jgi:hypothetical protein
MWFGYQLFLKIPSKTQHDLAYQLFKRLKKGRLMKGGQRYLVTNYSPKSFKSHNAIWLIPNGWWKGSTWFGYRLFLKIPSKKHIVIWLPIIQTIDERVIDERRFSYQLFHKIPKKHNMMWLTNYSNRWWKSGWRKEIWLPIILQNPLKTQCNLAYRLFKLDERRG